MKIYIYIYIYIYLHGLYTIGSLISIFFYIKNSVFKILFSFSQRNFFLKKFMMIIMLNYQNLKNNNNLTLLFS